MRDGGNVLFQVAVGVEFSTQSCICEEWKSRALYLSLMSKCMSILEGLKHKGPTQHHLMDRPNSESQGVIVGE